ARWFGSDLLADPPSYTRLHLLAIAVLMLALELWIVIEAVLVLGRRPPAPPAAPNVLGIHETKPGRAKNHPGATGEPG
ncbi:MAG: hypothetical protein IID31_12495, partial [Planctomycetes bacterium]|nr:hypothetical protein [Planctomycetota bacterium]